MPLNSQTPSDRRAQARAVSAATPRSTSRAASSSAGGASNRTCWQREAIVGMTFPGRSVSRTRCAKAGGSSSVLSIRLAASSFIVSARSITKTRRRDSKGVRVAAATTGSSMSETSMSAAPLGATHVRSGCAPRRARARALEGSAAPSASSSAAKARATSRLPAPAGPWNR